MRYIIKIDLFNELTKKQVQQATSEVRKMFSQLENHQVCYVYELFTTHAEDYSTIFVDVGCFENEKVFNEALARLNKIMLVFSWRIKAFLDIDNLNNK